MMKFKQTKDQQQKELTRQQRTFKVLWLVMPLSIVGLFGGTIFSLLDNQTSMSTGYAMLISSLITAPLSLLVYNYSVVQKVEHRKGPPAELHFSLRYLVGGFLLAAAIVATQLIIVEIFGSVSIIMNSDIYVGLAGALGVAILAAFLEELFNRGVIFRFSEKYIGSLYAILVSAVIFGMPHMFNPNASLLTGISITLTGGIALALVFIVTGNLWASIGIHAGWNFTNTVLGLDGDGVFTTTLTGPKWLIGSKFGIEDSITLICIWLVVSAVLFIIAKKRQKLLSYAKAKNQKHPI